MNMGNVLIFALTNALLYVLHPRLVWRYVRYIRRAPNIAKPLRYSERMLWRKIVDHNPAFIVFSDKLAAREYARRTCPDMALPEILWTGDDADGIPDELLRGGVLVKANHGSSFNRHIRAGQPVDRAELKATTERWLRTVYGTAKGEWTYAKVTPRLFVEKAVGDSRGDLIELQVRAGNGKAIAGSVTGHTKTPDQWSVYLDTLGNPTLRANDKPGDHITPLPEGIHILRPFRQAIRHAEALSVGVDYARFDFLWNGTELYGGEITVFPASGSREFMNATMHDIVMAGWDLTQSNFLKTPHAGLTRIYAAALCDSINRRANPP